MQKLVFCILFLILTCQLSIAQNTICGHDLVMNKMERLYPDYKESLDKSFTEAIDHSNNMRYPNTTFTIPVVVHVVWKEEEEKLDSSFILSQIEILNEDFQRQNADADNIRPIFEDIVGNPMINFDLKEIKVVQTDTIFDVDLITGQLPDYVKLDAEGGSSAVDPDRHLNIWICNIQPLIIAGEFAGQLFGYAYPPNDLSNWPPGAVFPEGELEGIVLDYRTVGRDNPFTITFAPGSTVQLAKGRTAVHEVGHYLGLRHVWGDGTTLNNSCNVDDGIADTPNAGSQTIFDCNPMQNTCSDGANDRPDMIENFMDSAAESCQNSFSQGQANFIRAVLELQRCELVEVCQEVSTTQLINTPIDIYPNPSKDIFYIQNNSTDLSDFNFIVYNSAGKQTSVQLLNHTIDLTNLPAGIYYLTGQNKTHVIQKRIVKL